MQVMFVHGLEHALAKMDDGALRSCTRIVLQDDMTFTGSAAKLMVHETQWRRRWRLLATDSAATVQCLCSLL